MLVCMDIISRDSAISQRLTHYFTGKPCKRFHVAQRYTKTQSCVECLHPKFDTQESVLKKAFRDKRKTDKEIAASFEPQMTTIRLKIHLEDYVAFKSFVLAQAQARCPQLEERNILTRYKSRKAGASFDVHVFRCFDDDRALLYTFEQELLTLRGGDPIPAPRPFIPLPNHIVPVIEEIPAAVEAERNFPSGDPWK